MKSHARVVVIGGGVVGCSVLYHLARAGWSDALLLERDVLTCGSTWHAAGGFHTLNGDPNVAKLQQYTVELYREIEELSGLSCGLHLTGGVQLAKTQDRMDALRQAQARGRYMGMELDLVTPEWTYDRFPLIDPKQFIGGLWDPIEGHLDPSGTTQAYARSAKKLGAEVEEKCKVEGLRRTAEGWEVRTSKGTVMAEHVVNAGGLWAREVGRMVGLELPVLAMEHHYILTETIPEVVAYNKETGQELIHIIDFEGEIYTRQERDGILLGTYERAATPWQPKETPWDFGHELLQPDFDRIAPSLEVGFEHFPPVADVGIRQAINGPFTFAPDGNPLVGPVRGLPGFWCACGVMAGFSQGGGVGLALSNWMVDGDPGFDVFAMDVARFGAFATRDYTNAKVRENYSRRFRIRFPNEELPAARPFRTSPIYDVLKAQGAQFGAAHGLEVPLWFAPEGVEDVFSWRRSADHDHVGAEARAVRDGVGVIEITGFAKYTVAGEGAEAWLDRLLAARLPAPGRMALAPMLKEDGRVIGDFTVANLGEEGFFVAGSGVAEDYHMRCFDAHAAAGVTVTAHGPSLTGLSIAGPKAREVLAALTDTDVGPEAFRFMDIRRMDLAMAPCLVGRISFTGDLGYEVWMPPEYQRHVYHAIKEAGAAHGIRDFGLRALNALRLEKNWGGWGREYRPVYDPWEAGLDRFVALDKAADFVGKDAAAALKAEGGKMRLRTFTVAAEDADVIGDEPIWQGGEVVGWVTSGGYAHASDVSVALGYVPRAMADRDDGWEIEILGHRRAARLQPQPLFDANGSRMRA
ncbi:FAD-dependent oxidoreductase [Rhodobacteraceae bacterium CCMM004]|nr:FAD-dependent oxidoreductase [Rhodobacteraceae bacterium CCMM004]